MTAINNTAMPLTLDEEIAYLDTLLCGRGGHGRACVVAALHRHDGGAHRP